MKRTAIKIVNWIHNDLPHYFDNKTYLEFVAIIVELFEDPVEKQMAMSKLDALKQGGRSLNPEGTVIDGKVQDWPGG